MPCASDLSLRVRLGNYESLGPFVADRLICNSNAILMSTLKMERLSTINELYPFGDLHRMGGRHVLEISYIDTVEVLVYCGNDLRTACVIRVSKLMN